MAARLGLDPSEFLEKMKGVEGFASGSGQRIAAEMKRTSREGAESLRLIDEALGVHLSRPVTRLVSQEFPALASGLQSILGAGVFGAIGIAGIEAFEKLAKSIEKAQKVQEEFRSAGDKVTTTLETLGDSWAMKIAKLQGQKSVAAIISEGAAEARKQFEELTKALDELEKKRAATSGWGTQVLNGIGNLWTSATQGSAAEIAKNQQEQMDLLGKNISEAFRADMLNGTHTALTLINADLTAVNDKLKEYRELGAESFTSQSIYEQQTDNLKRQAAALAQAKAIEDQRKAWEDAKKAADDHAAALKAVLKLTQEIDALYSGIQASYAKLTPIANPFVKVEADLEGMRMKADNDFAALAASGANALELRLARQRLDEFISYLHQKMAEARKDSELWAAEQELPNAMTIAPAGPMAALPSAAPSTPALSMAPMRADLAELEKVQTDANAAWAKAGQVLQSIESPAEKVQIELETLRMLLDQGHISEQQYNAAVALTSEQLTKAALHARELQEQLEKLEKNSTSASSGMKAFLTQIQLTGGENGKVTFDLLSEGLKGFEDNTVKILEGARVSWRKYFEDLAAMALKFMETKTIANIASAFTHAPTPPGGAQGAPILNPSAALSEFSQRSLQYALPLPGALPPAGALSAAGASVPGAASSTASMTSAGTTLTTAGTTLSTAGTSLSAAAAALNAAAASMSASGAAAGASGAGDAGGISSFAGFFAGGGDIMPGQDFIAGEAGPELIHAGSAGANVTPNSKIGGATVYNDFRGTVMTDDLMRRAEGMQAIQHSEKRMMAAIPTLQREINLRQRTNR